MYLLILRVGWQISILQLSIKDNDKHKKRSARRLKCASVFLTLSYMLNESRLALCLKRPKITLLYNFGAFWFNSVLRTLNSYVLNK